jgi:SAM-dependent methyltransferase
VLGSLYGLQTEPVFAWPVRRNIRILESSARGMMPLLLREKFDYLPTEYDAARIAAGESPQRYADFQKLSMDDASFDVVIASDVFEHVRRDRDAFCEVFRVLRPGGSFLLTVPYDHGRPETIVRVDTSGDADVHLLEPEYHGGGGHTLTYRHYGTDLLSVLRGIGFSVTHYSVDVPPFGISPQSVIAGRKGEFSEILLRSPAARALPSLGPLLARRVFLFLKFNLSAGTAFLRDSYRKIKG